MNLIKTTIFRVAIQFAVLFSLIATGAMFIVYTLTMKEITEQTDFELQQEIQYIEKLYQNSDLSEFYREIKVLDKQGQHLNHFYAIWNEGNQYIAGNLKLANIAMQNYVAKDALIVKQIDNLDSTSLHENIFRYANKPLSTKLILTVAQGSTSMAELKEHTFPTIVGALSATCLLTLIFGAYFGKSVLSRVHLIDSGVQSSIDSDFKQLLPVPNNEDEFQSLTLKLNQMLVHIEHLISGMRQITDDIAHDLRSPLTRMKNRLEVTLLNSRNENEYCEVINQTIADCNQLIRTFNDLLSIAQAEAGVKRSDWAIIDLSEVCEELAELYSVVAEEKGHQFIVHCENGLRINGNKQLLAQAISNLLENAIKYTPEPGVIQLTSMAEHNRIIIEIKDSGKGIPENDQQRVLNRFQRLDSSRTSTGNGLGLSLVNAAAKIHQAKITMKNLDDGFSFRITFENNLA